MSSEIDFDGCCISICRGDITKIEADAIVNAANSSLMGGGGVDGAIHRAAGPSVLEECRKVPSGAGGRCPTGEAVATTAGDLKADYIIHTVGPRWRGGNRNEDTLLRNAYYNSLLQAVHKGCRSIAFPSISTGVYRFPVEQASSIAVKTVKEFLSEHKAPSRVVFVLFSEDDFRIYAELLHG